MQTIRLYRKHVKDLAEWEYDQLIKLNYGYGGWMRRNLKNSEKGITIIAKIASTQEIVGWALLEKGICGYDFLIYIHKNYRRQGIGTRIYRMAKKHYKKLSEFPHNKASRDFFSKMMDYD